MFIGRAQEKTALFRTEKRHNTEGRSYPWIVKSSGLVNQFYFYCVDADFGPFFIKFCSYFPHNAKLQRQPLGTAASYESGDRVHRTGQWLRYGRRSGRAAGDLRAAGPRDRCTATQMAGDLAASVHRSRPGRRLPL